MSKSNPRKTLGLTLIEVTLVIAVLLGLISVLFIGVAAYKKGADRAECLVNSASVQKAVRAYANIYQLNPGDSLIHTTRLVGSGGMFETEPACPQYGAYLWETQVPAIGTPYIDCWDPNNSAEYHYPQNTAGW
jgi:competence protein ComGC